MFFTFPRESYTDASLRNIVLGAQLKNKKQKTVPQSHNQIYLANAADCMALPLPLEFQDVHC